MADGLLVWNEQGLLQFNAETDLAARELGTVAITGGVSGSVAVPVTGPSNTPWFYFIPSENATAFNSGPKIEISGNTISWNFDPAFNGQPAPAATSGSLSYGRY